MDGTHRVTISRVRFSVASYDSIEHPLAFRKTSSETHVVYRKVPHYIMGGYVLQGTVILPTAYDMSDSATDQRIDRGDVTTVVIYRVFH